MLVVCNVFAQPVPYLQRFPPNIYNAGSSIYHILTMDNGLIYFASNQGLLEYNGEKWEVISIANNSETHFISTDKSGRIYVGAVNEFGFLAPDSSGHFIYTSLASSARSLLGDFGDVWQAITVNDAVYFQSYEGLFEYTNGQVAIHPLSDSYVFNIGDELYGSSISSNSFGPVVDGEIQSINSNIDGVVYQVFPFDDNVWLLVTAEVGMYLFDRNTNSVTRFNSPASDYLMKYYFFDGKKLSKNLYAFGTWEGGLLFMNKAGDILQVVDKEKGLLADMVYHVETDLNDNLWLGTSDGIAKIDLAEVPEISWEGKKDWSGDRVLIDEFFAFMGDEDFYHYHFRTAPDSVIPIHFGSTNNTMEFYFSMPGMIGDKVEYRSMLIGEESEYSDWLAGHIRTFNNLGPGDYTFEIQARNSNGIVSDPTRLSIRVDLPLILVIGRYLAIAAIVALLSFIIIQVRTIRLRRTNEMLEKLIDERTKELVVNQQTLERSNNELLAANKELDSFVYHTSHDLKAPLKSVLGLVSLSKREITDNTNLKTYLEMIEKSVQKLEEFIRSVIEYSVNTKTDIEREQIDFDNLIAESLGQLQEFDGMEKMTVNREINLSKPFYSDPKRLSIVFNNIISNAVKYRSGNNPELKINVEQVNGHVAIAFADNGQGIEEQYQGTIFDMFTRASEGSSGSGLGLYIVKGTIDKLDGEILVHSTPGVGSTFTVNLPNQKP